MSGPMVFLVASGRLTDDDLDFPLLEFAQRFRDEDRGFPVSVTVLRYGSLYVYCLLW